MLRLALIGLILISFAEISIAQIRATTENGKNVILFDNGTWQYDETKVESPAIVTETIIAPAVTVDSTREITTDLEELFYLPSPRLVRYFGDNGGKIRCKLSSSNILGNVTIQFSWEFPVVDGDRYFGSFGEGTALVLTMSNDYKIELTIGGKSDMKRLEKHNYSVITNSTFPLSNEQLTVLTEYPIRKIEVDWKKKSEEYQLENSRVLMDMLPTVF
jgi:hypothetical protein